MPTLQWCGGGVTKTCRDSRDGRGAVLSETVAIVSLSAAPPSRAVSN